MMKRMRATKTGRQFVGKMKLLTARRPRKKTLRFQKAKRAE